MRGQREQGELQDADDEMSRHSGGQVTQVEAVARRSRTT